jgi:hypothetical protein
MPKSRLRVKPDTSRWFLTEQTMSVPELVAGLRREQTLLSPTAREWRLHRDPKPKHKPSPYRFVILSNDTSMRAAKVSEGDSINASALKDLVRAAVAHNLSAGGKR